METNDKHFKEEGFLSDSKKIKDASQRHKALMGFDTPDNYFAGSRKELLSRIHDDKSKTVSIFKLKPTIAYAIAAILVVMLAISFWLMFESNSSGVDPVENKVVDVFDQDDAFGNSLVSSLLVEEESVESFVDGYILNEIFMAVDRSEEELENSFMNSLFIEDSLIDDYVDESLLDNIIL